MIDYTYQKGDTYTVETKNVTLTAQWVPNEVTLDHSALTTIVGDDAEGVSDLDIVWSIPGHTSYPNLEDVSGYRHTGWMIDDVEYPVDTDFVTMESHTAYSVWTEIPAMVFDHSQLVSLTALKSSAIGLPTSMKISDDTTYPQLESRDGCDHIGWLVDGMEVAPTAKYYEVPVTTAVSLWSPVPVVVFDHSDLFDIVGVDATKGSTPLEIREDIRSNTAYVQLPDNAGYRHVGWEVEGRTIQPTDGFVAETTHIAKSLWVKIEDSSGGIVPVIPDQDDPIVIVPNHEFDTGTDGRAILLAAIVVAIIAELAVLCISRKR